MRSASGPSNDSPNVDCKAALGAMDAYSIVAVSTSGSLVRGCAAHRNDARRNAGGYDFLQEQSGPHLQVSPHAQPGAWLFVMALWQPQSQAAPEQDEQLHGFELVNIFEAPLKF
ncbi:MAG: hypothetical protein IT161_19610 [Bryobacterales bacterium]|nr:hypothetical protein [Bryobacterales bacterium]MCZ2154292.1 hypothetical protein [Bryobacterales bacterium]